MSLYDDVVTGIPGSNNTIQTQNDTVTNWSNSSFKLMQMQVEAAKKRQSLNKIKPAFTSKTSNKIAPVIDLSDKRGKPQLQLKKEIDIQSYASNYQQITPTTTTSGDVRFNSITGKVERTDTTTSIYSNSTEEYDPMRPNDYEILINEISKSNRQNKETNHSTNGNGSSSNRSLDRNDDYRNSRRKHSRSRSRSRDRSRKKESRRSRKYSSDEDRSRSRSRRRNRSSKRRSRNSTSSDDSDGHNRKTRKHENNHHNRTNDSKKSNENETTKKRNNNAAFAPPPQLLEDTGIIKNDDNTEKKPESALPTKSLFGNLKAEKMMAKMGYKEGDGLGKNKQGMSIALQVEKTGKRIGKIIHEKDVVPDLPILTPEPIAPVIPVTAQTQIPAVGIPAEVMKNMSKVVLLKNMVGPGDVDDDLEAETKEECSKYGEVNRCIIFEIPTEVPEEAVRIFLEFKTLPSAIKALTDLNGRYFGGRAVKALFYNFDKFKRLELAD